MGETVYRIEIGKYKLVYGVKPREDVILVFLFMHESQSLDNSIFASFYAHSPNGTQPQAAMAT